ncbi:MAG: hypothetical protein ABJL99_03370 [Aliishimia sp.]
MRARPQARSPRHVQDTPALRTSLEAAIPSGTAVPHSLTARQNAQTTAAHSSANSDANTSLPQEPRAADDTDQQTDAATEPGTDEQPVAEDAAPQGITGEDPQQDAAQTEDEVAQNDDATAVQGDSDGDGSEDAQGPVQSQVTQAATGGDAGPSEAMEAPALPRYVAPDMNAIRSPIVRLPPAKAVADTQAILADTGSPPSQHHADIQGALFRVGQAARAAQREMVQEVESVAVNARWDIEAMASQIDGIIARACGIVQGAASAAYSEIETLAEARIQDVLTTTVSGSTDMEAREATVRQQVVDALRESGSGKINEAHNALVAAYDTYAPQAAAKVPKIAEGTAPDPIKFGEDSGETIDAYTPAGGEVTTFAARGEAIVGELFTSPAGGAGNSQFYEAFIGRAQAGAVPYLATEHRNGWVTSATTRAEKYKSADNRNKFVLTALGLVAPTAEAMDVDAESYQETLSDEVYNQYGRMSAAQERAVSGMESTLRGPNSVKAFFNSANPKSMPAKVVKGLRKTGAKMKQAMMDQARLQQAGYRASIADMAKAYPDVIARIEDMLGGDDLLDGRTLGPKIEAAAQSLRTLKAGHIDATQAQATAGVDQSREGFRTQIQSIWDTVDGALDTITEQKEKSKFHFELSYAFYSGEFKNGLDRALAGVSGYAETAATQLLAPIASAETAGTRVQQRAISFFNGQLAGEWEGYIKNAVNKLDEAIGHGGSGADADRSKPLPTIEKDKRGELNTRGSDIEAALRVPNTAGMVVGVGVAVLTPPPINWIGGAYAAQQAYEAIPSVSGAATALAMPWPGPLALNYDMDECGRSPNAKQRVEQFVPDGHDDKSRLLGLFSSNEGTAAASKQALVTGADRMFGVNDDAVEALSRSFSPSELATLSEAQKTQMQASVRSNLSGTQLQVTEAYIDGNPARAAAIRIRADLDTARRGGDAAMAEFTRTMDSRLKSELQSSGGAYVPPEQLAQLTDQMFVEMTSLIPPEPGPGRTVQTARGGQAAANPNASTTATAAQTLQQTAPLTAAMSDPDAPQMSVDQTASPPSDLVQQSQAADATGSANADQTQAADWDPATAPQQSLPQDDAAAATFQQNALERARSRPDAATVQSARDQFAAFATRDYVSAQYYGPLSPLIQGQGDGRMMQWLAPNLESDRLRELPGYNVSDGRSVHGNVIIDQMETRTSDLLNAYISKGSASPEYRQARAVQALTQSEGRTFGASEADIVALSQSFGAPALSMARSRLSEAENTQPPNPAAVADAQAAVAREQRKQDLFIFQVAGSLNGQSVPDDPSPEEIAAARALVAGRINTVAGGFNGDLANVGTDLTSNGSIDLGAGLRAATDGWGTHDALLNEVVSNRRRNEFTTYFAAGGQGQEDGITRASLGVGQNADYFGETSGDQAQKLEIAFLGVPENSADEMDIAGVRARHQLQDGTGFISALTMEGSPHQRELQQAQGAIGTRVHASIAANDDPHNPVPAEILAMSPSQLVNPDGTLTAAARKYSVDRRGNFFGSGPTSADLSSEVSNAARNYSAEIGRQESFFTGLITAAAVAVSVLLLLVPGVNVAAAGVLTALIAGSASIAVKAGMRGDRYGWEEAAVDVARTGIEAATAGVGGALGGAVKPGAGVLGRIAGMGAKINKVFPKNLMGTIGAAATREAITSAASGVANQALDDKIWTKGIGDGFGKLAGAGLRGAVTGAVSGGVSEGLTGGVKGALGSSKVSNLDGDGLNWLGKRLSGTGREIVEDAISGMGSTAASEFTTFLMDVAEGKPGTSFDKFLAKLGPAMLKELASSSGRGMAKGHMRKRLQQETTRVMSKGGEVSLSDAVMLRRLAISAGVETYGAGRVEDKLKAGMRADASANALYFNELKQARAALMDMPQSMQAQMRHMNPSDILTVDALRRGGGAGDTDALTGLALSLRNNYDMTAPADFFKTLRQVVATDTRAKQADAGTRNRLTRDMPKATRSALDGAPVDAITALPRVLQDEAARLLNDPGGDPSAMQASVAKAKARVVNLDEAKLIQQVQTLMGGKAQAELSVDIAHQKQRAELGPLLPAALREVADSLPAKDLAFLHRIAMADGGMPAPKALDGVMNMLAKRAPHLNDEVRGALVGTMLSNGKDASAVRASKAAQEARSERVSRMAQLDTAPEAIRPALAQLAPDALLVLRKAQTLGPTLGEADLKQLVARARKTQPDLDAAQLMGAMKTMLAHKPATRPFFERFRQRRALITFAPKAMRGLVRRTPILTLSDAAFVAYVRANPDAKARQNAVTIRLNGEVVILVREGADAFALREEGAHVVQMHDPSWSQRLQSLDEATLNDWPSLSVAQQADLARTVVDAEIDAHVTMIASLRDTAKSAFLSGRRGRAQTRLEGLQTRLAGLQRRKSELAGLSPAMLRAMELGQIARPAILDQPARLFNENDGSDERYSTEKLKELEGQTGGDPQGFETIKAKIADLEAGAGSQESTQKSTMASLDQVIMATSQLPTAAQDGLRHFLGAVLDQPNDGLPTGLQSASNKAGRLRGMLRVMQDSGLMSALSSANTDATQPGGTDRAAIIGRLLTHMGNDFAFGTRKFDAAGNQTDFKRLGLGSRDGQMELMAGYSAIIKQIDGLDAPHISAMRGPIADFVATAASRRSGVTQTPGHKSLRNKLFGFVTEVSKTGKVFSHLSAKARVGKLQASMLQLSTPLALKSVDAPVLQTAIVAQFPQFERLIGLADVDVATGDLKFQADMDDTTFVDMMTKTQDGSPTHISRAQAQDLYLVFRKMADEVSLSGGDATVTKSAQAEAFLQGLYHAHRLMHDDALPSHRRLSAQAVIRLLESPRNAQFRGESALALQKGQQIRRRNSSDLAGDLTYDELRALPLPPNILTALAHMDQLLRGQQIEDGSSDPQVSSQVERLHAALEMDEKTHDNRDANLILEGSKRTINADQDTGLQDAQKRQIFSGLTESARTVSRDDIQNPTKAITDAKIEGKADVQSAQLFKQAEVNKARGKTAKELDAGTEVSAKDTSKGTVAEHAGKTFRSEVQHLLEVDMSAAPFELATKLAALGLEGKNAKGNDKKAAMLALQSPLGDGDGVQQIGPDTFFVRVTNVRGEQYTGFISNSIRVLKKSSGNEIDVIGGSSYPEITEVVRLMRAETSDFNLFDSLTQAMRDGALPDLKGVDVVLQHKVQTEMALAVYLLFGVEVIRHPVAHSGAIMALYLGSKMRPGEAGLTPSSLLLGNPEYKEQFTSLLKSIVSHTGEGVSVFDGDGTVAANSLMTQVFRAQQTRLDAKSGGLFPSTLHQFMTHAHLISGALKGSVDDPATHVFADEVVNRYAILFEVAVDTVLRERLETDGLSAAELITRELSGDESQKFFEEILLKMQQEMFGAQIDPSSTT